jgi:hypothetical protein
MHRLGDDEAEVVGETVRKPLMPVGGGVGDRKQSSPRRLLCTPRLGRSARRPPTVEGAAAFEIEAGVVPMTGQDAVLDAAAFEREAHMRATIVESEDALALVDDKDRTMATVHNEPPLFAFSSSRHIA